MPLTGLPLGAGVSVRVGEGLGSGVDDGKHDAATAAPAAPRSSRRLDSRASLTAASFYDCVVPIDERALAHAREHPRGTERRTLLPFRDALNDVASYARLSETDRDAIVSWVEMRRRLRDDFDLDHDPANLADPLLPYDALRAQVIAGECAARRLTDCSDPGGDVPTAVRAIRSR